MTRYERYQAVRKLNPDLFWNTETQKQMHDEAKKMGGIGVSDIIYIQSLNHIWISPKLIQRIPAFN